MNSAAQLDLNPLLNPRLIAVIGASAQGGRATGAVRNLQELGFTGAIWNGHMRPQLPRCSELQRAQLRLSHLIGDPDVRVLAAFV